jgi:hypothetical protein
MKISTEENKENEFYDLKNIICKYERKEKYIKLKILFIVLF